MNLALCPSMRTAIKSSILSNENTTLWCCPSQQALRFLLWYRFRLTAILSADETPCLCSCPRRPAYHHEVGSGVGALVAQGGTELDAHLLWVPGNLIITNCGCFRDKKRMNPDQVSPEDRLRWGRTESHGQPAGLPRPTALPLFVFNQPVSTVTFKAICVASYLRGFGGYPAGFRKWGLGGRGGLFGFCRTPGGLCGPSPLPFSAASDSLL